PDRAPDFGPRELHPTAGASAVGARPFLVAYNVYLGPASNLSAAREVAAAVRHSSGGLRYVKALALEVEGQAQVSMNLVDLEGTPLHRAYEVVRLEAAAHGVAPTWSEIVGLVPERALLDAGARHVQLRGFTPAMLLEKRVRDAIAGGESTGAFVASVAAPTPAPGGGSVAAHVGALAAALAQMVAGLTVGRKKYAAVDAEMRALALRASALVNELTTLVARDARAYQAVTLAYKLPKEPADAAARRSAAVDDALVGAAEVPLETARACAAVAELAATVARQGNVNAVSDAGVAALLAEAACRGAAYNVRINVSSMSDRARGAPLARDAQELVARTARHAKETTDAVEAQLER
ncbi:MAG TPA: formimidoyltransferase-cyclodeaminase, partial [Gemmatimonadaceae bacterium]|nr:formimidoyltransferase-cyclodeaminase [Gemmatimonadaceae bacterium]